MYQLDLGYGGWEEKSRDDSEVKKVERSKSASKNQLDEARVFECAQRKKRLLSASVKETEYTMGPEVKDRERKNSERPASGEEKKGPRGESPDGSRGGSRGFVWLRGTSSLAAGNYYVRQDCQPGLVPNGATG